MTTTTSNSATKQSPGDHIVECVEICIPIPYGHLAAKWWGRRDVRPIVCLHGWQDNAGTFDTLIPLLPDHVGYLAIDLPGHGLSPFQPPGIVYGHVQYLYILNYVFRQHFKWPSVSIIAHSMSSQIMFEFAATFPDYIDLAVGFDMLKPAVITERHLRHITGSVNGNLWRTDENNLNDVEPPSYSYDELIDRMVLATGGSVDRVSAPYLLQRGTKVSRSDPDRFYFSRDNRLKTLNSLILTSEMIVGMAAVIQCPYLFFKSLDSSYSENKAYFREAVEAMQASNPLFQLHGVDGGHHVHLTEPEKVAVKMVPFIRQYRPDERSATVETRVQSKL